MRSRLLLFALSAFTQNTHAQDSTVVVDHPAKFIVKLAPLYLLNGYFDQSVRLSLEYTIGDNHSTQVEYGWYPKGFNEEDVRGYYVGVQLRHFFLSDQYDRTGIILGFAYKQQHFDTADSTWSGPNTANYYQHYTLDKDVFIANVQVFHGTGLFNNGNLWLEGAVGLGVRYKNVSCNGLTAEEEKNRDFGESMVLGTTKECFGGTRLNLAIDLKMGYAFR
ncbi:MAG: hypothetical protein ABI599_14780 [Flavobacteriales bacterium]